MDWNRTLRKLHHKNSEPHRERGGVRPSAEAAMKSGVAQLEIADLDAYEKSVAARVRK